MKKSTIGLLVLALLVGAAAAYAAMQLGNDWQNKPERLGGTTRAATTVDNTFTVTGAATMSSTLNVTGAATLASTLDVTGATTLSSTLGYRALNETSAADNTITAAESGKTFFMGTAGEDQTLPAPAAGLHYRFVVSANFATTNMKVQGPAADATDDVIFGSVEVAGAVVACSAEDTLTFVADTNEALPGDWIELVSNGTNWYLSGSVATASAFTCTDAD